MQKKDLDHVEQQITKMHTGMINRNKVLEAIQLMLRARNIESIIKSPHSDTPGHSSIADILKIWLCHLGLTGYQATIQLEGTAIAVHTTVSKTTGKAWFPENTVVTKLPLSDPNLADNIVKLLEKCDRSPSAQSTPS